MNDNVNHPAHYTYGKIECLDVILDWNLNYLLGQVLKYICRHGKKYSGNTEIDRKEAELEDLRKSQFYLNKEIDEQIKELEKLIELEAMNSEK